MKFSHLIEINDPLNPLIDTLTREQLWRGLVMRAEQPLLFVEHLDDCRLSDKSVQSVARELRYGKVIVKDVVSYLPQLQVRYQVPKQQDIAGSSLIMTIEEPEQEMLFVRFEYEDDAVERQPAAQAEQEFYDEFRRSAYQEADIDTIRVIRELAAEGKLG
ncbi:SRPBCC family protein [Collimonas humicola]|uniref:SRPBCC family protein n=1 Tax=Collimonas humicola TaxID=2825886 RepID=UPI001B8D2C03|nr:SRPBCC family protein [Collimonas humicola]